MKGENKKKNEIPEKSAEVDKGKKSRKKGGRGKGEERENEKAKQLPVKPASTRIKQQRIQGAVGSKLPSQAAFPALAGSPPASQPASPVNLNKRINGETIF